MCFLNCFNTCSFNVCFSFYKNFVQLGAICFNVCFSFYENFEQFGAIRSVFTTICTDFEPTSDFFCKNFEQCCNCCSNNCLLFEQCAREAASLGTSWPANRSQFTLGRACFIDSFCWIAFCMQKSQFPTKLTSGWIQTAPLRMFFFGKSTKREKCVWAAQACTDCI